MVVLVTGGPLECREDFFREEHFNTCVPICPNWKQDNKATAITLDVVIIISYTSGFVIAIAIVIISIIRRDSMCVRISEVAKGELGIAPHYLQPCNGNSQSPYYTAAALFNLTLAQ